MTQLDFYFVILFYHYVYGVSLFVCVRAGELVWVATDEGVDPCGSVCVEPLVLCNNIIILV